MSSNNPAGTLYDELKVSPDLPNGPLHEIYKSAVMESIFDRDKVNRLREIWEVLGDPDARAAYNAEHGLPAPQPDAADTPLETADGMSISMRTQAIGGPAAAERTRALAAQACPACGFRGAAPDGYCEECGYLLADGAPGEMTPPEASGMPALKTPTGVVMLRMGENIIGRIGADVCIADPTVSKRHARLMVQQDGVTLEDLGSVNGTRVNDRPIAQGKVAVLHPGDTIRLGKTDAVLIIPAESAAAGGGPTLAPAFELVGESGELRFALVPGHWSVGRKPERDIVIPDPYVSSAHAHVEVRTDQVLVTDLGSTNGTLIDGVALEAGDARVLPIGSTVQFGSSRFVLTAAVTAQEDHHQ